MKLNYYSLKHKNLNNQLQYEIYIFLLFLILYILF